ncbi:hypothetical protein Cgig2_004471 [Carnegiea gigantea]|uniref:Reverse transcriptase domain-containing protein n=1 Tax=Carnegiea gigantea TaxID=171969 RepID=A0A9Q1GM31_9CARY|nr:hypothetical protein Cgig2_004471 [Carnegiea gigantea]
MAERQRGQIGALGFPSVGRGDAQRRSQLPDPHREKLGHPMLRRPHPMTAPPRPQNARKYCEFHEQSGHTTTECRELKKALHELADKGQIDRFLKRGLRFLRQEQTPASPPPRDEECSTEIKVNPTGMIHLLVRFGDRNKFKSLEVDFLVVDHNLLQSFLKTKAKIGTSEIGERGLHVGLSIVLAPFLLGCTSFSFQRDRSPLQQPVRAHPQSPDRPQNTGHLKIRPQESARPCGGRRGRPSGLADSPAPWLGQHRPRLLQLALQLFLFAFATLEVCLQPLTMSLILRDESL